MTPDALREFCLALPQAHESFPFGEDTSVFKTSGNDKIFALGSWDSVAGVDVLDIEHPLALSLKCDPEDSIALRDEFVAITPGYHLNKKHWITVRVGAVPDDLVEQLISGSHALVRPKMPRSRTSESM